MSNNSRFLDGFILGAVVGAVAALLYAPQSGEQTRTWLKKVKDENQDLIDNAKETSENLIAQTKAAIDEGIEKISSTIDEKKRSSRKKI
ncbi:MAG: YtxH domain-containing protein [Candidatus Margulisbacteria bacterium]|nr:YtxH domain-containing protein [Candidatus Margulisiibacteriota bacterium]